MRSSLSARLIGAAAASCLLWGCDGTDPVAMSIDNASLELRSINPSGGPTPSASVRKTKYQTALSALKAPGGEPTDAQKTAIALLTAEAEAGLAVIPLNEGLTLDRKGLSDIREARALLAQWRDYKTAERTARLYDPTDEIADIDDRIAKRDGDITLAEGAKAAIDGRIQDFQNQINEKMTEAREERAVEADLRTRARGTSAVEGAELIKSARAHQRIADALEVESEKIQVRVDQLERQAAEAQLEIDRRREQRALLARARMDAQARAAAAAEQAAEAANNAEASAQKLNVVLDRIEQARASSAEMAQKYDEAIAGFGRAVSSASRAQNDQRIRGGARAVVAVMSQTLGDAHEARARGAQAHVSLLELLVAEGADLPGSAGHQAVLDQAMALQAEHERLAAESYQKARDGFSSTTLRDEESRATLERLDGMLEKLAPAPADG